MKHLVVISGCSGGGKSTLLTELEMRGFAVVPEPGRRIIADQSASGGHALPWLDLAAFAERAMVLARGDRAAAMGGRAATVFFDRGLVDAATALEHIGREGQLDAIANERYHGRVFMTPPWPEIYVQDSDRRHGVDDAAQEYERLLRAYSALGYEIVVLPKVDVAQRADFVLARLPGS